MMPNQTLFQFFHWYAPNDGQWWNYCAAQAGELAAKGITKVYLPPAYKSALGNKEPGYAVYDMYDLGEFDQKNSVGTKYGTKEEYLNCIHSFHENDISVIADIVFNHRHGADEKEKFNAILVNPDNRTEVISESHCIEGYTKFNFNGRQGKYSNFEWNYTTFSGIDGDLEGRRVIYKIQNECGEQWADVAEKEFGNYDYLMGADIEFRNEYVRKELHEWGVWYVEQTGVDGFRMDAVKHIEPAFIKEWLQYMRGHFNADFFTVSEYWKKDVNALQNYLDMVDDATQLFDVPLHFNFHEASLKRSEYDLRTIFDNTLTQHRPELSVTFIDNHDTQPLQSLESPVDFWFKPLAYALILLREQGIPMVFYPCLYSAGYADEKEGTNIEIYLAKVAELEPMLNIRKALAYGQQIDYFDDPNCVGWVRLGHDEMPGSGCAVVISNNTDGIKQMDMGTQNAHVTFKDACGHVAEEIVTDENGIGSFMVKGNSVSVWIKK